MKVAGKSKVHYPDTRDYDEALVSSIEFKKSVREGIYIPPKNSNTIDVTMMSLIESAEVYLNHISDIDVPEQKLNNFTKKHVDQVKYHIQQFFDIIRQHGVEPSQIALVDLNDELVSYWYKFLKEHYSQGSWNTIKRIMCAWINYFINKKKIQMENSFNEAKFKVVKKKIESVTEEEFYGVLDAVDNKSPHEQLNDKKRTIKNRFRPYLKDGFRLAVMTGLRREELVSLRWSDLQMSQKTGHLMFVVRNLKVERQKQDEYEPKYVIVYPQLMEFLIELGYEKQIGNEDYIIEPERSCTENTMMIQLTKSWTHYFKQAFPDRPNKPLKHLRKTYLSYLNAEVGDDMGKLSSHSGIKVLKDHYLDAELVVKGAKMKMFK